MAVGISNGNLVELLTTSDGHTFTIIWTNRRGISCMLTSGEGWRVLEPPKPGQPL